jgi:hypothetical protein
MEDIYKFIDNNYSVSKKNGHNVEIIKYLNKCRNDDIYSKHKQQIEWEIEFFEFIIERGNVSSLYNNTDEKGIVNIYPNYETFTNDMYEYLMERKNTDNILLSLRYRHILLKSNNSEKNDDFVNGTIKLYLSLLEDKVKENYNEIFLFVFENALPLAINRHNYRIDVFYKELENFILQITDEYILIDLVEICLKHNNLEITNILKTTITVFDTFINNNIEKVKQKPSLFNENLIDCKIKLLNKLGVNKNQEYINQEYINKGWFFEQQANRGDFIDNDFMFAAIKCYNKAGNKQFEQLATLKYTKQKRRLQLATVTNEYYSKPLFDVLNNNAIKVSKRDGNFILQYISKSNNIFIDNNSKQNDNSLDGFSVLIFDINNNISNKINKNQSYSFKLTLEYLKLIFKNSILSGSLTYETISKYIFEHTWLGKDLPAKSLNNDDYTYNWFSLLSLSIYDFITQYSISLNNKNFNTNYILAIDSLSIKFEAVLKDFAFYNNISTDKYDSRKEIMKELYIEDILNDESSKSLIGEENTNFMKYIFTKNGLDVRNNIAHCYFNYSNYTSDTFLLVLTAFLRLGSLKLTNKIINISE